MSTSFPAAGSSLQNTLWAVEQPRWLSLGAQTRSLLLQVSVAQAGPCTQYRVHRGGLGVPKAMECFFLKTQGGEHTILYENMQGCVMEDKCSLGKLI